MVAAITDSNSEPRGVNFILDIRILKMRSFCGGSTASVNFPVDNQSKAKQKWKSKIRTGGLFRRFKSTELVKNAESKESVDVGIAPIARCLIPKLGQWRRGAYDKTIAAAHLRRSKNIAD
ncbi:hypothetical protein Ddc_03103 [Ditylenchus destructor]|nr:hypothetical protein Ddc_03103 [Ditylenchus destructor]